MKKILITVAATCSVFPAVSCTGISLTAKDGSYVQARTIEGSQMDLPGQYVIIPRGQQLQSFTPVDAGGMKFKAKYGVVGLAVVRQDRHRTSFGQVSRHTERYALDISHRPYPPQGLFQNGL